MNWFSLDLALVNWRSLVSNSITVSVLTSALVTTHCWIQRTLPVKFKFTRRTLIEHWCQHKRIWWVFIPLPTSPMIKFRSNPFRFIRCPQAKITYVLSDDQKGEKVHRNWFCGCVVTRSEYLPSLRSNWGRGRSKWRSAKFNQILCGRIDTLPEITHQEIFPLPSRFSKTSNNRPIPPTSRFTVPGILRIQSMWRWRK